MGWDKPGHWGQVGPSLNLGSSLSLPECLSCRSKVAHPQAQRIGRLFQEAFPEFPRVPESSSVHLGVVGKVLGPFPVVSLSEPPFPYLWIRKEWGEERA